ncbi:MAG: phosphatase PAP2 family protein [Thalassolituus sp.]|uniref:phosphatase PAP2 family protein n=1 Tax=Thalassolituus TaxID=187492 RepID=UPI00042DBEC8|nr:phosphatase PAP2 family protein [Thalassolituus oleivorans]AHK16056.1 phosphoesterase PA-phosphatase [Thalassolituus oleivorans R6-15]
MINHERLIFAAITAYLLLALALIFTDSNTDTFIAIQALTQRLPDVFWGNMTLVADTLFAVAVLTIACSFKPTLFNQSFVLLVLGAVFVQGLKFALDIPRPPAVLNREVLHVIGPFLKNHSFPSGHSFTALATAGLLVLNTQRSAWAVIVLIIASVAALSRAAVGAHWPLDICIGSASGLLFAWLAIKIVKEYTWLQTQRLRLTAAVLMTIASCALLFHDSRYPDTRLLGGVASILAVCVVSYRYWFLNWRQRNSVEATET